MDTAKWPQEFLVKPMNEIVTNTCLKQPNPPPPPSAGGPVERKARPEKDEALNCPRCNSLNTKFCYYNNYSLTQPRFFCKDCRRYWTAGGSLRNIPVGGGIRKNKRSSPSPSPSSSSKKPLLVNNNNNPAPVPLPQLNPKKTGENSLEATAAKAQQLAFPQGFGHGNAQGSEVKDLKNSAFSQGFGINVHSHHQSIPEFLLPSTIKNNSNPLVSTSSALELLGISNSSNSRPPYMPYPNVHDSSMSYTAAASGGFGLSYPQFQDFTRPTLGFSLDGGGYGGDHGGSTATNNGRTLLQFESLKMPVSSSSTNSGGNEHQSGNEREKEGEEADQPGGFWSGMLNAGTSATSGGSGSWQ